MLQILATVVNSCTTGFDGVESCTQSQVSTGGFFAAMAGFWLFFLALYIFMVVVNWKVFTKAGKPGWASLIPIYNVVIQLQIVGKPDWWVVLLFVPFVNFVVAIMIAMELAKSFGKSSTFGVLGLILFPYVGYPMLAFGSSTYKGPGGTGAPAMPSPGSQPGQTPPPAMPDAPSTPVPTPPAPTPQPPAAPTPPTVQ